MKSQGRPILLSLAAALLVAGAPQGARAQNFLYKELNFLASLSTRNERFDLAGRPPLTSGGLDYYYRFRSARGGFFLPAYANVHVNLFYEPMSNRFQVAFLDLYLRWKARESDTFFLMGQFNVPFGANPIQQPRGILLFPLQAVDLGFKKDWGLAYSSTLGDYWYKMALTTGTGTGVHTPEGSYLLSGRIGSPTYLDFEHGFSLLYGQVPKIRGIEILDPDPVERWRMGLDFIYKYRSRIMFMGEAAFGADDNRNVWGLLGRATIFPRAFERWQFTASLETWNRNAAAPREHDTQFIAEAAVSATEKIILRLHWIHDINRVGGRNDEQIFLQVFYYAI